MASSVTEVDGMFRVEREAEVDEVARGAFSSAYRTLGRPDRADRERVVCGRTVVLEVEEEEGRGGAGRSEARIDLNLSVSMEGLT